MSLFPPQFSQTTQPASFSPTFESLLAKRGFLEKEAIQQFLDPALTHLYDPLRMKGMREAVARIRVAIKNREKILIHGDYDVDGVTAAAIVAKTLKVLEADFDTFLPERSEDGYGVSRRAIERGGREGVKLFMTADCGITAAEEIEFARSLGMDVIVIDHHRIPASGLPPANIILNPLQEDCPYPFKELSAGGLAFKLSQALLGTSAASAFLDLAAASTVCDVAPLKDENRVLVKNGLVCLGQRNNLGFRAIAETANIKSREMNTGHVGFMIGPRINAAGRMSSPAIALQLLLTQSDKEAKSLAQVLEEENRARQLEEKEVLKEAIQEIERLVNFKRDRVIVVGRRGWHVGVIGIVASRLVERFHRPAVVIGFPNEGAKGDALGKGSGRSIKGFHLFNALQSGSEVLAEFGGHEQAAGLSIEEKNLDAFRQKINQYARDTYEADVFVKKAVFDLEISLERIGRQLLAELEWLEPHGAGNPRPVFLTPNLEVKTKPERLSPMTIRFFVTDGILVFEALWSDRHAEVPACIEKGNAVDIYYSIKSKEWQGQKTISLEIKHIQNASR